MFDFKTITLDDRELFKKYININKYPNSEYCFTTFYAWQNMIKTDYTIIDDCLVVKGIYKNKSFCYFPMGTVENTRKCIQTLKNFLKSQNKPLVFSSLSHPMLELLKEFGYYNSLDICERRDYYDYVYKTENLITLKGKKLHGKKNHYNFFVKNNEFSFEDITAENEEECALRLTDFILDRSVDKEDELTATIKVLKDRDALGLISKCLYVNGVIVGVILGENHHDTALLQISKSDISYRGASVALFKHFLSDYFPQLQYTNLMEDLGLEGLRQSKLSYNPEYFVEKYFCSLKDDML